MAQEVENVVVQKIASYMVDNIVTECSHLCYYKSNIKNLEEKVAELVDVGDEVERDISTAKRKSKVIGQTTVRWVEEVGKIKNKADRVLRQAKKVEMGCFKGRLNIKQRYLLSREATNLTNNVGKHRRKAPKDIKLAHDALPAAMLSAPSPGGSQGLESRMSTIKEVLADLENDQYSIIGLCGMPGVGKTGLAKEILNIVLKRKLFHEVGMVVVSENRLTRVQGDLADMLSLPPFKETCEEQARARILHERLKTGSKILLILDDVLKPLELTDVGLPATGDYIFTGLKVLFTSQMEQAHSPIQAQKYITVKVLPDTEAMILFKRIAGKCVETSEFAAEVLKECGGLPIAIVTLGKALENGDMHDWENALHQLQNSTVTTFPAIHERVYKPIQLSYNLLGSRQPQAQRLLMLCCLFPNDANIPVEKLIRNAKGLRLSEDVDSLVGTTDRVMVLLKELKNCFLLLPGDKEMTVKMHKVVRSVCLSFASQVRYPYIVKHHPELYTWPNKDGHESICKAISLTLTSEDQMPHQLPEDLYYPKLELLQLLFHCDSLTIPKEFFHGMKQVRVLDFKQISFMSENSGLMHEYSNLKDDEKNQVIERWGKCLRMNGLLPNPEYLVNLRTLSLEFCELSCEDLLLIGHLKQLEILSFFASKIMDLPPQTRELTNLKLLDLRSANGPNFIPSGVISAMTKLEELYMGNYDSWPLERQPSDQWRGIRISELSALPLLKVLQFRVKDGRILLELSKGSWLKKLRRFHVTAIRKKLSFYKYEIGQYLIFDRADWSSLSEGEVSSLLSRAEHLTLKSTSFKNLFSICRNLKTVDFFGGDGVKFIMDGKDSTVSLNKLKSMKIQSMDDLEGICDGDLPSDSLVELETLELDSLRALTQLWRAPIDSGCLGNLRVLEISYCESVRSIFPYAVAKCLVQLQKLDIKCCDMLEGVVSNIGGGATEKIEFQKLTFLSLDDLPSFRGFLPVSVTEDSDSLTMDEKPLESIKTEENHKAVGCGWFTRKRLATHTEEYPTVEILNHDDSSTDESSIDCLFSQLVELPSLNKLLVGSMNNVKHIVNAQTHSKSVSKLRIMRVVSCEKLLTLAASDAIRLLTSLEQVIVQKCESLKAVFDFRGIKFQKENAESFLCKVEMVSLHKLNNLKHVWHMVPKENEGFKMLKSVEISSCCSLTYVFSLSVAKMLDNLQSLQVKDSSMVEEIIERAIEPCALTDTIRFPQLRSLKLENLSSLTSFSSGSHAFEFPELHNVIIKECHRMSNFCLGQVTARKLRQIKVGDHVDQWVWKGDLNTTTRDLHNDRLEVAAEEIGVR